MRQPLKSLSSFKLRAEAIPGDPAYRKLRAIPRLRKKISRGKYKKILTNVNIRRIMERITKLIRKDDKKMTEIHPKASKKSKSFDWRGAVKSLAWLIEAAFRGFVGWILLSNFDNTLATAAAFYALGTAGIIVVMHFVRANRK